MFSVSISGILLWCAVSAVATESKACRCVPTESCWPSTEIWKALNSTVDGQLNSGEPLASSCYAGPQLNETLCTTVRDTWTNASLHLESPSGSLHPVEVSCPPLGPEEVGRPRDSCTLGSVPSYSINATSSDHVAAGLRFAQEHNIRLVVRDTGHDFNGRSAGFGSLQVWIRHLRTGVTFHDGFHQEGSTWNGSAVTIGGGYDWGDVSPLAAERGLVVVGGLVGSVGCIGGFMQGGGHGTATPEFGLSADQMLSAQVVLANGTLVTVSPKENVDLYFALRGGGGGTYGVVVEVTMKAWPTTSVVAQTLLIAPLSPDLLSEFIEAMVELYQAFPSLADAGWGGYGSWSTAAPIPLYGNSTIGYTHSLGNLKLNLTESEGSFAPLMSKLREKNGTALTVSVQYVPFGNYSDYFNTLFAQDEVSGGTLSANAARLLDAKALLSDRDALRQALHTLAGTVEEGTAQAVELLGGTSGGIRRDAFSEPRSAVLPAWRDVVVSHTAARGWTQDTPPELAQSIRDDITLKEEALRTLAPDTGCYMNVANWLSKHWKKDFYGSHYQRLRDIKAAYDPQDTFYCPTCVGSDEWEEDLPSQLCRV